MRTPRASDGEAALKTAAYGALGVKPAGRNVSVAAKTAALPPLSSSNQRTVWFKGQTMAWWQPLANGHSPPSVSASHLVETPTRSTDGLVDF